MFATIAKKQAIGLMNVKMNVKNVKILEIKKTVEKEVKENQVALLQDQDQVQVVLTQNQDLNQVVQNRSPKVSPKRQIRHKKS